MFHVPELARDVSHPVLGTTLEDGNNGAFHVESPEPGWTLALIASDGEGWEHVSVHAYQQRGKLFESKMRTPTWKEMSYVKRLCWDGEDVVIQLHPRESEYVNCHPHVLHLWRPTHATIPTPDPLMVGPRPVDAARPCLHDEPVSVGSATKGLSSSSSPRQEPEL